MRPSTPLSRPVRAGRFSIEVALVCAWKALSTLTGANEYQTTDIKILTQTIEEPLPKS
jgi:hypothetical protein